MQRPRLGVLPGGAHDLSQAVSVDLETGAPDEDSLSGLIDDSDLVTLTHALRVSGHN